MKVTLLAILFCAVVAVAFGYPPPGAVEKVSILGFDLGKPDDKLKANVQKALDQTKAPLKVDKVSEVWIRAGKPGSDILAVVPSSKLGLCTIGFTLTGAALSNIKSFCRQLKA